jgi:hypothetical protein
MLGRFLSPLPSHKRKTAENLLMTPAGGIALLPSPSRSFPAQQLAVNL